MAHGAETTSRDLILGNVPFQMNVKPLMQPTSTLEIQSMLINTTAWWSPSERTTL